MSTITKNQIAMQFYDAGNTLFQEGRFPEAVEKLKRAEDVFRKLDARGHPFGHPLPNGVSGLANACYLQGLCYQKMGDYSAAIMCFETGLINEKFERKRRSRPFLKSLKEQLLTCYEKELEKMPPRTVDGLLRKDPEIDLSFSFPFSLAPELVPIARLYELEPERYQRFKEFYTRARHKSSKIRRTGEKTDEAVMQTMSFYVWGIIVVLWLVYGFVVMKALYNGN